MSAELCEAERGCTTCYKWASKCGPSGFWPGINNARKLTDASPVLAAPSPSRVTAARASGISPAWTRRSLRSPRSATRGPVRRAPRRTTRRSRTTWRPVSLLSRRSIQSWRKRRPKGRRRRRSTRGRGKRVRQSPHSLGSFAEPTDTLTVIEGRVRLTHGWPFRYYGMHTEAYSVLGSSWSSVGIVRTSALRSSSVRRPSRFSLPPSFDSRLLCVMS